MSKCLYCGRLVKNKYCDSVCQGKKVFQDKLSRLDESDISKTFRARETQKKYIVWRNGSSCSICGLVEWQGREAPLIMDHVDGNSENNSVDNLRLVCANCDMQLPTYKAKNRGNGRYLRRERYASGESY